MSKDGWGAFVVFFCHRLSLSSISLVFDGEAGGPGGTLIFSVTLGGGGFNSRFETR